jgi:transposase
MKFKSQLIENITFNHIVVGVDIAQETHVARAFNFRGVALGNPLVFSNDEYGFKSLDLWIRDLLASFKLSQVIVGMEPTGHYWFSLAGWLKNKAIEAVLVNPNLVKKNKENRDNTRSKSEKKDALVIADMVKNGYYSPVRFHSSEYEELRVLMANRETVVKRLVSAFNQIHRWSYAHGNALLRHAGLNVTEASSGKWKGQLKLSKRGRPRLRHFLYLITMYMVMSNQEFKALHHHNVQVKKLKKMKYYETMWKASSTMPIPFRVMVIIWPC